MVDHEKVREFFSKDYFALGIGVKIEDFEIGRAVCTIEQRDEHLNAGGVIQGGVVFTLADFAFAIATNCGGTATVSLENNISYIAPATGKLTAVAQVVRETGKLSFCDVEVFNEKKEIVSKMSVTGYKKGPLPFAKKIKNFLDMGK